MFIKRLSFYSLAGLILILSLWLLMVCNGCGVINIKTKDSGQACTNISEGSYSVICEISHKMGQEPEDIASVLKLANLTSLTTDVYAAAEAKAFIADVRKYVQNARKISEGFTYNELVQYVVAKYSLLPKKVQALLIVLDDYAYIDDGEISAKVLSDYDFTMVESHLDEQDRIVDVFLESASCTEAPTEDKHV